MENSFTVIYYPKRIKIPSVKSQLTVTDSKISLVTLNKDGSNNEQVFSEALGNVKKISYTRGWCLQTSNGSKYFFDTGVGGGSSKSKDLVNCLSNTPELKNIFSGPMSTNAYIIFVVALVIIAIGVYLLTKHINH